jgi:hypothetical protein
MQVLREIKQGVVVHSHGVEKGSACVTEAFNPNMGYLIYTHSHAPRDCATKVRLLGTLTQRVGASVASVPSESSRELIGPSAGFARSLTEPNNKKKRVTGKPTHRSADHKEKTNRLRVRSACACSENYTIYVCKKTTDNSEVPETFRKAGVRDARR